MSAPMVTVEKDVDSVDETSPARVTAVCLGLGGFSIGLIGGLEAGAEADQVLFRAIVSLFVCYLVGYVMGLVGGRVVDDAVRSSATDVAARVSSSAVEHRSGHNQPGDAPIVEVAS